MSCDLWLHNDSPSRALVAIKVALWKKELAQALILNGTHVKLLNSWSKGKSYFFTFVPVGCS